MSILSKTPVFRLVLSTVETYSSSLLISFSLLTCSVAYMGEETVGVCKSLITFPTFPDLFNIVLCHFAVPYYDVRKFWPICNVCNLRLKVIEV